LDNFAKSALSPFLSLPDLTAPYQSHYHLFPEPLAIAICHLLAGYGFTPMICQQCHQQEATTQVHITIMAGDVDRVEHLHLCQECADSRMDPEFLKKAKEARARGKGTVSSGWTGLHQVKASETPFAFR
jgi:hypothetical protein